MLQAHNLARLVDDRRDDHVVEQVGDEADSFNDHAVSKRRVLVVIAVVDQVDRVLGDQG